MMANCFNVHYFTTKGDVLVVVWGRHPARLELTWYHVTQLRNEGPTCKQAS
jgi:hypothetical protein